MGVKGLWHILAPGGRRIKLESLEGKILAIDASIWVIQFMYAIKQGKIGNNSSAAHLHGFVKRICKLLFFGIRPVFVFDGKTPALKKRTLVKRRNMQLQRQHIDFKKAAERLIKKYLDQNLRSLREQHANEDDSEAKGSHLNEKQQEIKDTIARIAQMNAEKEIEEIKESEKAYEDQLIQTLIIEYGMLLQENDIEIEEFAKLENERQYDLIKYLKNMKQQKEFKKLAEKSGDLAEYSKASIASYIESVNEKQNLLAYRIKASNEYQKLSKQEAQNKKFRYDGGQESAVKNRLPEVFTKPLKKRKRRKVDQMIMELEQENIKELRENQHLNQEGIDDIQVLTMNPAEIFEKLNLAYEQKDK